MAENDHVTRIRASDNKKVDANKQSIEKVEKGKKVKKAPKKSGKKGLFASIGGYFKGAWYELRQVRWPNRRATWALTLAVLVFSIFFMLLITLLDALFKWFFELIIV